MSFDPGSFLRTTFPKLFHRGVAVLAERASQGNTRAQRLVEDVKGVSAASVIQVGDTLPIFLSVNAGTMTAGDQPAQGIPVQFAAAVPVEVFDFIFEKFTQDEALDDDEVTVSATQLVSKRVQDAFGEKPMTCRVTMLEVPRVGDVQMRMGFNVLEPPMNPGFTVEVRFADLDAVRRGSVTAQELFLGGGFKLAGDYTRALQIAMQLLTDPISM